MDQTQISQFLKTLEDAMTASGAKAVKQDKVGLIVRAADGVITITGLPGLAMGELVEVEGIGASAVVLNLEQDSAQALLLTGAESVSEGATVKATGQTLSMPVGEEFIGRVVDGLGNPLDGKGKIKAAEHNPHEKVAPSVVTREQVNQPVQTGILAIDALVPIGRGQRELIIGDRQTGKTTIAVDTIINQKGQDMICIYVSIGQREARLAQLYRTLKEAGALDYTIIVSAPATSSAGMQFIAPYGAVTLAEYFMAKGQDVLIIYDDLSKHAVAYREMSLLLGRPPGREAYPGDVFYLHSRLLERAARMNQENGGGSITALPIIETQAGDISAYIPTNVISITDGQIFLENGLFHKGIRPAMNVGVSVSRVGGTAQTKIMKKVSGSVKLELAQYYELEAFSQFASELDASTRQTLKRGRALVESLKQRNGQPWELWQEVVLLYAGTHGFFDDLDARTAPKMIAEMLHSISKKSAKTVELIDKYKELTPEVEESIKQAVEAATSK
jgi:F-type H+/Na+-transporting ATPase subunit alpha